MKRTKKKYTNFWAQSIHLHCSNFHEMVLVFRICDRLKVTCPHTLKILNMFNDLITHSRASAGKFRP